MNEEDRATRRGWCIDYAIRMPRAKQKNVTAEQILSDAKKFERYMFGSQRASVLRLSKSDNRGDA
jgi:hypothetical protein